MNSTYPPMLLIRSKPWERQSIKQSHVLEISSIIVGGKCISQVGSMHMIQQSVANFHWKYTTIQMVNDAGG